MSDSDATEAPPTPKRNLRPDQEEECEPDRLSIPLPPPTPQRRSPLPSDPHVRIAMYVAMAHAGMALSLALLYGLTKLLEGYWRPIQWAILCSMPLRGLHRALVSFWSDSLALGLFQTLIAVPIAALRAATASIVDSQAVFLGLVRGNRSGEKIGFSELVQWLISFVLFVIVYENNIDSLAVNYNMTEIVDGVKLYLMSPTTSRIISNSTTVSQAVSDLPLLKS